MIRSAGPRPTLRAIATRSLPAVTGVWLLVELLSLRIGLLNRFFFDTLHADVQGVDFYSLPRAWLNLRAGRSLYGTFDPPPYGPHFTWYLAHPLLATILGGPLSQLEPADSYGVFTLLSLAVMTGCAWLLGRESEDPFKRRLIPLLLLGAFPSFSMLYVGNVQAFPVLGVTLLLIGMLRLAQDGTPDQVQSQNLPEKQRMQQGAAPPHAHAYVLAGLLVSLFSKPVVLPIFLCCC